ncbi:protein of unknown function [Rubritalea squalenifaciens DSM 18772]|uniref:3-keto-alpha-glucoside-1,2-lyase/3-keto-2-hydroxy-glucal hydratase domain-containing protein n=1 Tax=Rubritalea squalenifaciens DSM 18772 TaxID=1123071 RepID=A0A1M6IF45_9BACT|nr:DUF1080 domain-containing protein [Rubritalea squalenifaciens]SHJ33023.1 protein of unknown function [Rubritalea squalenifaciens DSM 18772]
MFTTLGKTITMALGVCALGSTLLAAEVEQPDESKGWKKLFDGKTTKGWRTYNQREAKPQWQAVDGALTLTKPGGGNLITEGQYENFDLRLEWKIPKGRNSGLFIGAKESERVIYQDAIEMQILGNTGFPKLDDYHIAGSIYGFFPSKREWAKPDGEWNKVRILKKDGNIKVFFNDQVVADFKPSSEEFAQMIAKTKFKAWPQFGKHEKGHIGFQDHGDSHGLAIRNIWIKELDAK